MTELIKIDFKSKEIVYRAEIPENTKTHIVTVFHCMVCRVKTPYDSWKDKQAPRGIVVEDKVQKFVCLGCINDMYMAAQAEYETPEV